jgi:nucleotide-binding universal stress UspA family protein
MIKDIVVSLGLGERDPAGEFAVALAQGFGAHALGIAFAYDPLIPGPMMGGGLPAEFIETQRTQAEGRARAAIARFEKAAAGAGVACETRMLNASISGAARQLGEMARRFDLAVVGQPARQTSMPDEVVDEGVLFESGRPVVFVPFIQRTAPALGRVMLCWDGSRAAARAVADAMPLLHKAKTVEIVIVGDRPSASDEMPGADLGQHLARHGLTVEVKRLTATDIDVASALLSYAADSDADLMVMGGYGHSRLREFVLGGVTRELLESMTVPVLMSH